jgi:hypothetical protein
MDDGGAGALQRRRSIKSGSSTGLRAATLLIECSTPLSRRQRGRFSML